EGLIYVGTDDGLIQVTENGGASWRKIEKFPDVPDMSYVSRIAASHHDANTVYASFDNHKNGDFAPYLLKSTDAGKTWASVKGNLPARGSVLAIAEDPVNPDLIFAGTEFGLFFTIDCGQKWIQLKGGLPTIAVRDLVIQKRESDLVVGTFGRGIYILDDITPLRATKPETLAQDAMLFSVKDAMMYIESQPLGGRGKGFQGESFYTAENPPFGATFTYYLKESTRTKRQMRREAERAAERRSTPLPYPTMEQLKAEAEEEAPTIILTVTDASGRVIRRLTGPASAGMHRVDWDLRHPASSLPSQGFGGRGGGGGGGGGRGRGPSGPLVMPGKFKVSIARRANGVTTSLSPPQEFKVFVEGTSSMSEADRAALVEFQQKAARLQGAVSGALQTATELGTRIDMIKRAIMETPSAGNRLDEDARSIEKRLDEILIALRGDPTLRTYGENPPPSISSRVGRIAGDQRMSTSRPTKTQLDLYRIASDEFGRELAKLKALIEGDLTKLEKSLEAAGAPWTPGRIPEWKDN
ncbi:MAG: glycosyl hydrolase, partial [Blastocatellia bacterium]|nr:glycosyl hydrolase [Blastocatellia bacterium]